MRGLVARVDLGQDRRQQAVARHDEEHPGLGEHHHQDDGGQREAGGQPQHIADTGMADGAQHMGQRLARADHRDIALRRAGRREFGGAGIGRDAIGIIDRLGAEAADDADTDQQVEDRADAEAADEADGDVALRVLGLLGGGGDGVEADIGEEDDGGGRDGRCRAERHEGNEILRLVGRERQRDEGGERRHLDDDENGVDGGAFLGADDEQPGDGKRDDHGGQVDEAAGIGTVDQRHGQVDAGEAFQHADRIARPADRDRAGGDGIFQHQRPADDPGHQLPEGGVAVGIGGAGDRDHGGKLRIAERGQPADHRGDDEAEEHAGAGELRGFRGEDEDAGADDAADAEHGELEGPQCAGKALLFSSRENCVE